MKAFSSILKNFGKQLSSLASQMPWCNLRFNLGSMSVLSRVSRPFSRTSLSASSGTSFGTSRRASHFAAILTILFTIGVGSVSAQGVGMYDLFGYGQNATGGNATPILVGTESELRAALKKNSVVIITEDITVTSQIKITSDFSNVTLMALPGKKLISNVKQQSNSGILYLKGSNIIIRNVTFVGPGAMDCDGEDLLGFDAVTNAWVDHCDFQDGLDGNFDIKGNSDNITISWCRFHYLKPPTPVNQDNKSDDHRYTNLLGSSATDKPDDNTYNITYAYNWWDEGCVERMVRCRNASLHFLNCYWNTKGTASYYIGPENADCYIEGCYFTAIDDDKVFYQNYSKGTAKNGVTYIDSYYGNGTNDRTTEVLKNVSDRTVTSPSYPYPTAKSYTDAKTQITSSCGAGATLLVTESGEVQQCYSDIQQFTVTFNLNGRGDNFASTIYEGLTIPAPTTPTAIGYTFEGWYTDPECTNAYNFSTEVTSDIILYAKWTENNYCYEFTPATRGETLNVGSTISGEGFGGTMKVASIKKAGESISYDANGLKFSGGSNDQVLVELENNMQAGTIITLTLVSGGSSKRGLNLLTETGTKKSELTWTPAAEGEQKEFSYTVEESDGLAGTNSFKLQRNNSIYLKHIAIDNCAGSETPDPEPEPDPGTGGEVDSDGCTKIFWFAKAADATTAGVENNTSTFTGVVSGTSSVSGTITIDGTNYSVTGRGGNGKPEIEFTIPEGKTATLYGLANSSGSSARTLTLTGPDEYSQVQSTSASSSTAGAITFTDMTAGNYSIAWGGNGAISMLCLKLCDAVTPSCTAPESVVVTPTNEFGWRYSIGETISLTATATGGSGNYTYQWQKYIESAWEDIDGATSQVYTKENCGTGDGGSYRCKVSTGDGCDTYSEGYFVRVFTLNGGYTTDGEWTAHKIVWTGENTGLVTLTLPVSETYYFKVTDNDGKWFGYGDASNYIIQPWQADCGTGNSNIRLFTGPAGDYKFTINIEHAQENSPYVNIKVDYPEVTHPVEGYAYINKWWDCYVHYWEGADNALTAWGSDPKINSDRYVNICGTDYWYFPVIETYTNFIAKDKAGDPANTTGDQSTTNHSGQNITHNGYAWVWQEFTTYSITFNANGGTGSISAINDICPGTSAILPANTFTRTGYTFAGWATSASGDKIYDNEATIPNITANITLYAKWTAVEYTITYEGLEGATHSNPTTYTIESETITFTNPEERTGYTFAGWNLTSIAQGSTGNKTVTATWTANTYQITYKESDRTTDISGLSPTTYTYGTGVATLPTPTKTGYTFDGWYLDYCVTDEDKGMTEECKRTSITTTDYGNVTLLAKWTQAATLYIVTFNTNGGSSVDAITQTAAGAAITLPTAPTKSGYNFVGWFIGGTSYDASTSYTPTADVTAYAAWQAECTAGGGGGSTTLFNVDFTDETTEEISTSNSEATFVAKTYDTYSMSFGVKSAKSINIKNGTGLEFTNNNYNDYQCLAIPLTLTKDNKVTATVIVGSGTVKYAFKSGDLPATPSAGSGSNASISGTTCTIEYTPTSTGNYVLYLDRSGSSSGKVVESIVITQAGGGTGECYYVTYDGNGADGGYVNDSTAYHSGSNTVTVQTNTFTRTGYTFAGWNTAADGTGTSYAADATFTISANTTLYAQWTTGETPEPDVLTAIEANTLYQAQDMASVTLGPTDTWFAGLSTNAKFKTYGDGSSTSAKGKTVSSTSITDDIDTKNFTSIAYIMTADNTSSSSDPTKGAIEFITPASAGTLYIYLVDTDSELTLKKQGSSSVTSLSGESYKKVVVEANTHYFINGASSNRGLYGIKFIPGVTPDPEPGADGCWNISDDAFKGLGKISASTTINGLTIAASETDTVNVDANSKEIDGYNFTHRLKLNGDGSADSRYLKFAVAGDCTIDIYLVSANSKETRTLNVATGSFSNKVATLTAPEAIAKATYSYTGAATDIYLYSKEAGINIYQICVTYPEKYTVTYKANGGTGSDVVNETATVGGCPATFTAPTDKEFSGWNTAADGSGTAYAVGDEVTESTTLYAQWRCIEPKFTVSYSKTEYTKGETASALIVSITEGNVIGYQWYSSTTNDRNNGTEIENEISASYTPPTTSVGTTYYWCEIENTCITVKTSPIKITVSENKNTPSVTWNWFDAAETEKGTINYGGGNYTIAAQITSDDWNGTLTADMLTAPTGINIYNVRVQGNTISATFDVTTSFDRVANPTTIPFYLSLPETDDYYSLVSEGDVPYEACTTGGGSEYRIPVLNGSAPQDGNYYYWGNENGWISPSPNNSCSGKGQSTTFADEEKFDYVHSSNSQTTFVRTFKAGIDKVRIYANFRTSGMTVTDVYKHSDYFSINNNYKLDISSYTIVYNGDVNATNLGESEYGFVDVVLNSPLAQNEIIALKFNTSRVRVQGAAIIEQSGGTLQPTLQWSNNLENEATVNKTQSDVNFTYTASLTGESNNTLGTITYSSSNPECATVNPTTGEVEITATGIETLTTTITATLAPSGCYAGATATYTISVAGMACDISAGTLALTNGAENKCSGESVTLTLTGYTTENTTLQWYKGDAAIEDAKSTTYTTTEPGAYSVLVTDNSNNVCAKRSNTITITNISAEASVTNIVNTWYIKNGRLTPEIALWKLEEGTTFESVTASNGWADGTGFNSEAFSVKDGVVYLTGTPPKENTGEDKEYTLTLNVIDVCKEEHEMTSSTITIVHQKNTDKHVLAFVVTGKEKGGFTDSIPSAQTTSVPLYNTISDNFEVQATNIYSTDDEKALKEYYSQFDIICITDYPNSKETGVKGISYTNAMGSLIDIRPILTMEAWVSKYSNWNAKGVTGDPKSPTTRQYSMLLQCKDHEIFAGTSLVDSLVDGETMYRVTMVDKNKEQYKTLDDTYGATTPHAEKATTKIDGEETITGYGYGSNPALQGFTYTSSMSSMLPIGIIDDGDGNNLQVGLERQYEIEARMMVIGVNSYAMERLTADGEKVIINALKYLMKKNAKDISDCSTYFVGGDETDPTAWSNENNWGPTKTLPNSSQEARILAPCVVSDYTAKVASVKIVTDGTYAPGYGENGEGFPATGSLTIAPNGALLVKGRIQAATAPNYLETRPTTPENLIVQAEDESDSQHRLGALIHNNENGETSATIQMWNPSYWEIVGGKKKKYWSYVAVPIQEAPIPEFFWHGFTYLYDETQGWIKKGDGTVLYPFQGIGASLQTGNMETFYGKLATTEDQDITLTMTDGVGEGQNLIGNSWTAPIQIANFEEEDFNGATATVYVYNTGRDEEASGAIGTPSYGESNSTQAGQWISVPISVAGLAEYTGLKVIPAMNAFQVNTTQETELHLDYNRLVRGEGKGGVNSESNLNQPMRAPHKPIEALMRIRVAGEKTHTDMWLLQDERFDYGFDNGWEAEFVEGDDRSAQLYAVSEIGKMTFLAQPELDGTLLGFAPSRDGAEYTFSFYYTGSQKLYLNDLKLQTSTLVSDNDTYRFTYEKGDEQRFIISTAPFNIPDISTGVGNTTTGENAKAVKFIKDDKIFIFVNGILYDATGKMVVR